MRHAKTIAVVAIGGAAIWLALQWREWSDGDAKARGVAFVDFVRASLGIGNAAKRNGTLLDIPSPSIDTVAPPVAPPGMLFLAPNALAGAFTPAGFSRSVQSDTRVAPGEPQYAAELSANANDLRILR